MLIICKERGKSFNFDFLKSSIIEGFINNSAQGGFVLGNVKTTHIHKSYKGVNGAKAMINKIKELSDTYEKVEDFQLLITIGNMSIPSPISVLSGSNNFLDDAEVKSGVFLGIEYPSDYKVDLEELKDALSIDRSIPLAFIEIKKKVYKDSTKINLWDFLIKDHEDVKIALYDAIYNIKTVGNFINDDDLLFSNNSYLTRTIPYQSMFDEHGMYN